LKANSRKVSTESLTWRHVEDVLVDPTYGDNIKVGDLEELTDEYGWQWRQRNV
jgi:hypothetical protein